jgi:hypothetical protein
VRQRAGHGGFEATSRHAAILDERDTSLADTLEGIFDGSRPHISGHENTMELRQYPIGREQAIAYQGGQP